MFAPNTVQIVENLLSGKVEEVSGISVGPLEENDKLVLEIIVDNFEILSNLVGKERAQKILSLYLEKLSSTKEVQKEKIKSKANPSEKTNNQNQWYLDELNTLNFRGLAPWGEEFEFDFNRLPSLFLGPNGSGKSSLLGAIIWCLTDFVRTDSNFQITETPKFFDLHELNQEEKLGKKIGNWPTFLTLPPEGSKNLQLECFVRLKFLSEEKGETLLIERNYRETLVGEKIVEFKYSTDGENWDEVVDLSSFGIHPLDLQLSFIAPSVFGTTTLDQAETSDEVLRILLGLEDLFNIGKLITDIKSNCTREISLIDQELVRKSERLNEELTSALNLLEQDSEEWKILSTLKEEKNQNLKKIKKVGNEIKALLSEANKNIAKSIGLESFDDEKELDGISDSLTLALDLLERGQIKVFPEVQKLNISQTFSQEELEAKEAFKAKQKEFQEFLTEVTAELAERLKFWRKEKKEGENRIQMLLRAARLFDPENPDCPVCEETIKDKKILEELEKLKKADQAFLAKDVSGLALDFKQQVEKKFSCFLDVGGATPEERIKSGWLNLKNKIADIFSELLKAYEDVIEKETGKLPVFNEPTITLLPDDTEKEFLDALKPFLETLEKATVGNELLNWGLSGNSKIEEILDKILFSEDSDAEEPSLFSIFEKGRASAKIAKILGQVVGLLRKIYKIRDEMDVLEEQKAAFQQIRNSLSNLDLANLADEKIKLVFQQISQTTLDYWKKFYPKNPSGFQPSHLSRKNKTIEATLKNQTARFPIKFVANAGLQRSVALAYFASLITLHPKGLKVIILDDVISSLDEEHGLRWIAYFLGPLVGDNWQPLLALHHRNFFKLSRKHFEKENTFNLTPRLPGRIVAIRPTNELERANGKLSSTEWDEVGNLLRKYIERVLSTLNAYSNIPFYNSKNLSGSVAKFKTLGKGSGIICDEIKAIKNYLDAENVINVVQEESHEDSTVMHSMLENAIEKLHKLHNQFVPALEKLEKRRLEIDTLYASPIVEVPPILAVTDCQLGSQKMELIGEAAAKKDEFILLSNTTQTLEVNFNQVVVATTNVLDPLIRKGQWALLADEDETVFGGDYAISENLVGQKFLRKILYSENYIYFQPLNVCQEFKGEKALIEEVSLRRVKGVFFEPVQIISPENSKEEKEWMAIEFSGSEFLSKTKMIKVVGNSLEPVARDGQFILVGEKQTPSNFKMSQGSLGAIDSNVEEGQVVKRVFRKGNDFILSSVNPIELYAPFVLPASKVNSIWPVYGVIFDSLEE